MAKSSNFITCNFFTYYKNTDFALFYAVPPLLLLESAHTALFWSCMRFQSYCLLPLLATPFASVLFISDTMQVALTTSHSSVLHGAICFCARKFCAIPRIKAVFKLKLIPSPEKMWSRNQHPPPWTEQCWTLPWQPHVRDTSANTWRHSHKCIAQTYLLLRSWTIHFAGEATEQPWFFSALLWPWSSFQVRAICSLWSCSLLHA